MSNNWHNLSGEAVLEQVKSNAAGLTNQEVARRLENNGHNELDQGETKTLLAIFLAQFSDLMIWVLIGAALISGLVGEVVDSIIIMVVVIINAVLGAVQENKAEAALEALKEMAAPTAKVFRQNNLVEVEARNLVTGDIVFLEAGDSVPADLRLIESINLKIEESALTGESVPVEKEIGALNEANLSIGDRINLAYMGTNVTYGRGMGVVIATGMQTEMGNIATQLGATEKEITPLQQKLNQISKYLSIGVIAIAVIVFIIGYASGQEVLPMFLTAVSLAVAAIPEGLVAVVTIVLAVGMSKMAAQGAIIRSLPAVETLGSTQIICSDKTGTLTQNKMTVQEVWSDNNAILYDAMGHCNDSKLDEDGKTIGDPTEAALINFLLDQNIWQAREIRQRKRVGEIPFDSERKLSTVAVKLNSGLTRIFVKGAPDVLLERCSREDRQGEVGALSNARKQEITEANEGMGSKALRVLAFGYKDTEAEIDFNSQEKVESSLIFCGLVGMIDPARPEAKEAIKTCQVAGIKPIMITGDHKITAMAVADDLGIITEDSLALTGADLNKMSNEELLAAVPDVAVYARVAPEHKSRIVNAWQEHGMVVAMTGDGVNDAPALKTANIGVGMGISGTDVSKQAADMVLTDDNFATIVSAVKEGRRIFDNIYKTVRFLLSSNTGEVIAILAATIMGWRLLAPIHILWINLVTDTFPALALGVEPAEIDIMERPPRDNRAPLLNGKDWLRIVFVGAVEAIVTLVAYWLGGGGVAGTTMAFLTLSLSQLFAAIGFQSERHSIFQMKLKEHRALWLGVLTSTFLQLVVVFVPFLREIFHLAVLTGYQWLVVISMCFVMLAIIELQKWIVRRQGA